MAVGKTIHELLEVVSCIPLREWTGMSYKVEELATLADFKCNELNLFRFTLFLMSTVSINDLFNHVWMI